MRIVDKIEFLLEEISIEKDWKKMGIKVGKKKDKKKKPTKSGKEDYGQEKKRAWGEEIEELKEKVESKSRTLECSVCGKPKEYGEMKHFKTAKGTYSVCKSCLAKKGKGALKETALAEANEAKDLSKYLKSMKGNPEKDIIRGLMKKFDLSKDDAERALELM